MTTGADLARRGLLDAQMSASLQRWRPRCRRTTRTHKEGTACPGQHGHTRLCACPYAYSSPSCSRPVITWIRTWQRKHRRVWRVPTTHAPEASCALLRTPVDLSRVGSVGQPKRPERVVLKGSPSRTSGLAATLSQPYRPRLGREPGLESQNRVHIGIGSSRRVLIAAHRSWPWRVCWLVVCTLTSARHTRPRSTPQR